VGDAYHHSLPSYDVGSIDFVVIWEFENFFREEISWFLKGLPLNESI